MQRKLQKIQAQSNLSLPILMQVFTQHWIYEKKQKTKQKKFSQIQLLQPMDLLLRCSIFSQFSNDFFKQVPFFFKVLPNSKARRSGRKQTAGATWCYFICKCNCFLHVSRF